MDAIVRLFRALANRERIRLLRVLALRGEETVSELAHALGIRTVSASTHLQVLAFGGVVWRRCSGRYVYYELAEDPTEPLAREAVLFVRRVFGRIRASSSREAANADQMGSSRFSDASLFALFTAFTHARRLQILRHLASQGSAGAVDMSDRLSMSLQACERHLDKLSRRGLIAREGTGPHARYAVCSCKFPERRPMLSVLLDELVSRP